jgi:hypothetical protein
MINLHWQLGRKDNFGKDQPLLEAEEKRINLNWLVGTRNNLQEQPGRWIHAGSTSTGSRGKKNQPPHWLVGRRDNFGKDQPPLVCGNRINLYWMQRKKGSTSTGIWGGGTSLQ